MINQMLVSSEKVIKSNYEDISISIIDNTSMKDNNNNNSNNSNSNNKSIFIDPNFINKNQSLDSKFIIKSTKSNSTLNLFEKILEGNGGEKYWKYEARLNELNRISNQDLLNNENDKLKGLEKLLNIRTKIDLLDEKIEKKYVLKTDEKNSTSNKKIKNGAIGKYIDESYQLKLLKNNIDSQIEKLKSKFHIRENSEEVNNLIDVLYSKDSSSWIKINDRIEIIQDSIDDLTSSNKLNYDTIASLSRLSEEIEISKNKKFKKHSEKLKILKNNIDNLVLNKAKEFGVEESRFKLKVLYENKFKEEKFLQKEVKNNLNKIINNPNVLYGFLSRHLNYGTDKTKYINDKIYISQLNYIHKSIELERKEMINKIINPDYKILKKKVGITYLNFLNNSFLNLYSNNENKTRNYSIDELTKEIKNINSKPSYFYEFKTRLYNISKIDWLNNDLMNVYDNISSDSNFYRNQISKKITSSNKMHKILTRTFRNLDDNYRKEGVMVFGNEFIKITQEILNSNINKTKLNSKFLTFRNCFLNETYKYFVD